MHLYVIFMYLVGMLTSMYSILMNLHGILTYLYDILIYLYGILMCLQAILMCLYCILMHFDAHIYSFHWQYFGQLLFPKSKWRINTLNFLSSFFSMRRENKNSVCSYFICHLLVEYLNILLQYLTIVYKSQVFILFKCI